MKTAMVTGASRGIGRAVALRLAEEGYAVALACRDREAGGQTVAMIEEKGGRALLCLGDVRSEADVAAMTAAARTLGEVELLVACAGIAYQNLFQYTDTETYDKLMDTNVKGAYLTAKALLSDMITRRKGSIIFISSMWGEVGGSCEVIYSASKAALIGMTKALAKEVGPSGIRVNCISPGVILTDMTAPLGEETLAELASETPLCRNGIPEDVADAVAFLASDKASFITGQILGVNGGMVV